MLGRNGKILASSREEANKEVEVAGRGNDRWIETGEGMEASYRMAKRMMDAERDYDVTLETV